MARVLNEQFIRMQKLAGLITEGEYNKLTEQQLEEGWKEWLLGGLITLSTAAGVGKVVQMDREAAEEKQKIEMYYDKVLSKAIQTTSEDDFQKLAQEIVDKKANWSFTDDNPSAPGEYNEMVMAFANKYMRTHADEFSISLDGKTIIWNQADAVNEVEGMFYGPDQKTSFKLKMLNTDQKVDKTIDLDYDPTTMFGKWDAESLKDDLMKHRVPSGTELTLIDSSGDVLKKGYVMGWEAEGDRNPIIQKR